uniref:Putative secreted peptide n=1 Tax=Anopheles braziliensis TaxID=58242 RepID=A0A2M3ZWI8_9DIPT
MLLFVPWSHCAGFFRWVNAGVATELEFVVDLLRIGIGPQHCSPSLCLLLALSVHPHSFSGQNLEADEPESAFDSFAFVSFNFVTRTTP